MLQQVTFYLIYEMKVMKKLLLIIGLFSLFQNGTPNDTGISQDTTYVWICTGPGAYAYHSSRSCGGLNNCRHEIFNKEFGYGISQSWYSRLMRDPNIYFDDELNLSIQSLNLNIFEIKLSINENKYE